MSLHFGQPVKLRHGFSELCSRFRSQNMVARIANAHWDQELGVYFLIT